ncbi:MAG: hypothetical protein RIR12_1792 [Bacteroidota bacterium]|jgi:hypothetical protein
MKTLLFFLSICFSISIIGQDTVVTKPIDSLSVIVHKDPRIDWLIKKQILINESTVHTGKKSNEGYRLMIISTNNRNEAIAAKTKIYSYFPELKAYMWHQSPYYKVKAGNFSDKSEAESYRKRLNSYFPKGVFLMKDKIEVRNADKDKD